MNDAAKRLEGRPKLEKTLYFAGSADGIEDTERLAAILTKSAPPSLHWQYVRMPEEKHSTIYHPAALQAFRALFRPSASSR